MSSTLTDFVEIAPALAGAPVNNHLRRTGLDRDFLYVAEGKRGLAGELIRMEWNGEGLRAGGESNGSALTARYTSPAIACRFPATEFLPSWNIRLADEAQGFRVSLRFYAEKLQKPSSWFSVGEGGAGIDSPVIVKVPKWGKTRIDYVELERPAIAFQIRVDFETRQGGGDSDREAALLKRLFVHYSGQGKIARRRKAASAAPKKQLMVPYRSQLAVDRPELRNHVCCPTSLAMILEYYGVNKPTLEICEAVYDKRYDMYGIWPHVSHVAFQHGFRSWVTRFRSHEEVRNYLEQGYPIISSIRVGEGELRNAKYANSSGHIMVLVGYKANGNYIVNDPFSAGPGGAEIEYFAEDIEKVWLDKGGVAILVEKEK